MNILSFISSSIFENKFDVVMFTIIAIVSTILMIFVGYRLLQMLQLSGYKMKGYLKWFKETKCSYVSRLFMLTFLSFLSMIITNVLLDDFFVGKMKMFSYISILFYLLFCLIFIVNLFNAKQKTPLKYTNRMKRLVVVYTIIVGLATWLIEYIGYRYLKLISFGFISVTPVLLPIFVFIAYYITYPIEKIISNSFIKKAKIKLGKFVNLKVIGITGSYGKTSVKNMLNTILAEKYKVCATPASYNTPLGLAKTILTNLSDNDEIFIAEMGAKQRNDINELCSLVNPTTAVITGIGNQHLLTFGSIENIVKTKGELSDFVYKNKGDVFINVDGKYAQELALNYGEIEKVSINEDCNKLKILNLKTNKDGSSFDFELDGKTISCKTILLGEHNISNIYLASVIALKFGLTLEEIAVGISKLHSIAHRLEIIKSSSKYTIIDDSYNSSVQGSEASIKVLSKFSGKKFVITPGLVELGSEQFNSNFEFGRTMAKVCDYVIINSTINFDAISSGLIFAGFDEDHIIQAGNLTQAVSVLNNLVQVDDVVLFENDLPDNYS